MSEILNFGLIITILKDIKHADNTRPITVSDSKAIVFEIYIQTNPNQYGLKRNCSTPNPIFIMRQIMKEIKRKKNVVPILTNVNHMLTSYLRCVSKNRLYTQFEYA
jgi:hypothetical protein